jgi:hypothetical protein
MSRKFSHAEYDALVEQTIQQIKKLGSLKGGEYSGDVDRLANFRRNGERLNLPMEVIWAVYAAKHWDAIIQYCSDLQEGKQRERMESLTSRVDDLIVYALLFKAMVIERKRSANETDHGFTMAVNRVLSKAPKDF